MKLAAIILSELDLKTFRGKELENIQRLYNREESNVLGVSNIPGTEDHETDFSWKKLVRQDLETIEIEVSGEEENGFEKLEDSIGKDYDFIVFSLSFNPENPGIETLTELDEKLGKTVEKLEENRYNWIILGDCGRQQTGKTKLENGKTLPRYGKETVIISNLDQELPSYTDQIHEFILDLY